MTKPFHLRRSLVLASALALAANAMPLHAETSTTPAPRETEYDWMSIAQWKEKHAAHVETAAKGQGELVFFGDSIIDGWQWSPAWKRDLAAFEPVNLGIGGDKTESILWRLENGETGKLDPKAVVLLVGTNNFGHRDETPEQVYRGVKAVVEALLESFPNAKILCLAIFPSGEKPDTRDRARIAEANAMIAGLRGDRVKVLDLGAALLEPDGTISKEIMGDFLHPTAAGYERATEALLPTLNAWFE